MRGLLLLLVLLCFEHSALAHEAHGGDPHVELSTSLAPESGLVPGQRGRLLLQIATPRWFTAGTKIALPEVPGVMLLQNQAFAANATERRGGESWSVQTWSIDVFATQPGDHSIPPVVVSVSVSEAPGENFETTLYSDPVVVTATVPEALKDLDNWVASSSVSLEDKVVVDDTLAIGGAVTRQVTVKARDVMAMMLPAVPATDPPLLQRYSDPPNLGNRSARGALRAQRSETISYIATQPGDVVLPGISVNWWNTETNTLTVLRSEPIAFVVTGEVAPRPMSREEKLKLSLQLGGLAAVLLVLWGIRRSGFWQRLTPLLRHIGQRLQIAWRMLREPVMPPRLNPGGTLPPDSHDG